MNDKINWEEEKVEFLYKNTEKVTKNKNKLRLDFFKNYSIKLTDSRKKIIIKKIVIIIIVPFSQPKCNTKKNNLYFLINNNKIYAQ